ncbi:RidA family protein [Calderihabitans maritimus]|uniref:LysR family transcriptional regulator n=1 Tax=Calderihabitans maritimus TaxID=1246530 RepID=A0A1Z5HSM1_9FIRM|nr:RidA family protein [Calderihabitans maritimus]GAW92280.1 LysR family transcriptional regulator [Calderihabitans maritimus]
MIEEKLKELGLQLPEAPEPLAAYVPAVKVDKWVYTAGQIPLIGGSLKYRGKLGRDLTVEEGYKAAEICALNCLSVIKAAVGSLDQIERIVKVVGFVNSAPGFIEQPKVINGASELLGKLFGEAGQHARSAVGVNELPADAPVEIEMIVKLK